MATITQIGAMCNIKVENVTPDAMILGDNQKRLTNFDLLTLIDIILHVEIYSVICMIVVTYVGSFAISTFGGSPTEVAAPPIFENKHTAIKMRIGLTAERVIDFMLAQYQL